MEPFIPWNSVRDDQHTPAAQSTSKGNDPPRRASKRTREEWTKEGWKTRKEHQQIKDYVPKKKRPRLNQEQMKKAHSVRSKAGWETRKERGWTRPKKQKLA